MTNKVTSATLSTMLASDTAKIGVVSIIIKSYNSRTSSTNASSLLDINNSDGLGGSIPAGRKSTCLATPSFIIISSNESFSSSSTNHPVKPLERPNFELNVRFLISASTSNTRLLAIPIIAAKLRDIKLLPCPGVEEVTTQTFAE